jgi:hypothetical protein
MDKHIFPIGALKESVPLRIVEPFHFSGEPHFRTSFFPNMDRNTGEHPGLIARARLPAPRVEPVYKKTATAELARDRGFGKS